MIQGRTSKSVVRKLEDAIHTLDEAVSPSYEQSPPTKKIRVGHSLYATLAKYGIKKEAKPAGPVDEYATLAKTAPHLAAILTRTATRTRKNIPFKAHQNTASTPSATEYRPSSTQSFLARLATFKLATYVNKPPSIDAVAAAKCGWVNDGKDRLVCGICNVAWVVAGREGLSREAANTLIEKQRVSLVGMHKDGCPWKTRQCDASIYRIPLQTPAAMAKEIKSRAAVLENALQDVEVKHPLTVSQVQSLVSTLSTISLVLNSSCPEEPLTSPSVPSVPSEPSDIAIITSLFGWAILPPTPNQERSRIQSLSRANSVAPATPARRLSRTNSVTSLRASAPRDTTPSSPLRSSLEITPPMFAPSVKPDTTLLHCALCQRRIGLWAFISKPQMNSTTGEKVQGRQLDVLREHRSYCPYVVRSTDVPFMPQPPVGTQAAAQSSTVEGWRAVLTVVLRHGLARRQRLHRTPSSRGMSGSVADDGGHDDMQASSAEVDRVEAMMAGVKSRGGKDLLRYVKGILG
ncbi:uncharacterized protein FIBRA_06425 [Fibroporia radiculosa]|uniref:C3HC-type domain-containing protein n=1 Tax=Fibroporia radiculosa TaxID=599839 RepID=J4GBG2_9APHY|nr:uncharacterized protein FIBRA_06425 [Fibroporia radiculosa]CCM04258.1 predicted protein [Fibroporia radiculosa]